ncbi:AraC family transcriptional regulator [Parathalassolituus penaei]|uniref:AraC family transcriptional regulator n=1 Tax=Parathalassolituus penaei TaxID=2997323 RepID=A0A9X3EEP6_9GAMM|nr:AraC family transcriptional regulator [Parathalassolituus penaei]MCY0966177.1 AraC family transcriptional regulator [Parathalassolituus penaei]
MLSEFLNHARVCFNTTPDEVSAYVNRHVGNHNISLLSTPTETSRLSFCEFSDIGLSRISYGNRLRVSCPDLENVYHLQVVLSGECQWQFNDSRVVLFGGQALMMNPGEKMDLIYSADCEKLIIRVPEPVLSSTCMEHLGAVPRSGVRFDRQVVDVSQSRALLSFIEAVLHEAAEDSDMCLGGLSRHYRDLLLRKLLNTFHSNVLDFDQPASIKDKTLERVLRHIDHNIKEDLTVEELAQVSGISVRKLYYLFTRYFATTPKLLIKQRKLNAIHRDLSSNPSIRNVTEAALEYSFTHLGRFSSDYRKVFGELPSDTLKRREGRD